MALVTIVGYPCSGKSRRSAQLASAFEARLSDPNYTGPTLKLITVSDDSLHVPRSVYDGPRLLHLPRRVPADASWSDSVAEKSGRANLFAAVTRSLAADTIVICDSVNYIKGFRYQMYCAAREAHARVCTVRPSCPEGVVAGSHVRGLDSCRESAGQVSRMA